MAKITGTIDDVRETVNLYDGGDGTVLNLDLMGVETDEGPMVAWVFASVDFSHEVYPVCLEYGITETASEAYREAARTLRAWADLAEYNIWGNGRDAGTCPVCGTHAVSADDFSGDGKTLRAHVYCDECNAHWVDEYAYIRTVDVEH